MIASLRSLILATALIAGTALAGTEYCTFFSDNLCQTRSGSVDYDTGNDGIFQNGGPFFACHMGDSRVSLTEYPPGDSSGSSPDNCYYFTVDHAFKCTSLEDEGFHPGNGGYYRLSPNDC